jgi:DNA-binding SARP family transcriptional activator/predicted ATPase
MVDAAPDIRLLGPLQLRDGIELDGPKQRVLLSVLALQAGTTVSADELAEAIWPGALPRDATPALQQQVSRLRRRLGDLAAIRNRQGGYVLELAPEAVDAHRFEQQVRAARRALDRGQFSDAAAILRGALDLWRGDALADTRFDGVARHAATRLEELRLQAHEDLLAARLEAGEGLDLVSELRDLVAVHPLRERLRSHLMLALYRAGRQAEALDVMRAGTRLLLDELGLEPGPELRAMERMILRQDDGLQAAARQLPAQAVPAAPNATVGRDAELLATVRLLRDPAVRLVTLTGPGGAGKSRLAACAVRVARECFPGGIEHLDLELVDSRAGVIAGLTGDGDAPRLLVLDGAERFAAHAGELARLLADAPALTVLATSRAALRLTSEHVVGVGPLGPAAAAELFAQRARASCPGWTADAAAVAQVCDLVDRLPLGIELAAARTPVLSVRDLVLRLEDPLGTLVDGPCDLPTRHRSLRETLAGTWALLDARERLLLGRLSVFDEDVTLEAAEAICNADGALGDRVEPVIASLLAKGGLVRTQDAGRPRFGMLTTLRAYAIEQAADGADDLVRVRDRYVRHADPAHPVAWT